jgi:cytochrome c-type biogenesis protein CcmE
MMPQEYIENEAIPEEMSNVPTDATYAPQSQRQRRFRFLLMTLGVTAVITYLIYTGMRDTMGYYLTVSELLTHTASAQEILRVSGKVQDGSSQWDPATHTLQFVMLDDAQKTVPVVYRGVVPDSFKQGQNVIVEGTYANDVFTAKQMLTPCASKYE